MVCSQVKSFKELEYHFLFFPFSSEKKSFLFFYMLFDLSIPDSLTSDSSAQRVLRPEKISHTLLLTDGIETLDLNDPRKSIVLYNFLYNFLFYTFVLFTCTIENNRHCRTPFLLYSPYIWYTCTLYSKYTV